MMSHYIHGFIAKLNPLREAAINLNGARVVPLSLGFGFLPIEEELVADDEAVPDELLVHLTKRLSAWAEVQSYRIPLAYVETEYFGGVGTQVALVWQDGRIAFGPEQSTTEWVNIKAVSPPLLDRAINRAVRLLGVDRGEALDEFDALGLGRCRSNDCWLSESAAK
jgi:hypothetical protein